MKEEQLRRPTPIETNQGPDTDADCQDAKGQVETRIKDVLVVDVRVGRLQVDATDTVSAFDRNPDVSLFAPCVTPGVPHNPVRRLAING